MPYSITRKKELVPAAWAGGATTELFIYPPGTSNAERNFELRISSATVELEESTFSDFSGYLRHIAPLAGTMRLEHEGRRSATLRPCETDAFDGSWTTRSFGTCVDFNLIHRPDWNGSIRGIPEPAALTPHGTAFTGIYALRDGVSATISLDGQTAAETLQTGDFLLIESEGSSGASCRLACETAGEGCFAVAAVACRR